MTTARQQASDASGRRIRVEGEVMDAERSLYHLVGADVVGCTFAGPADGESVLKEAADIRVSGCSFSLRYPMWHVRGFELDGSEMDTLTRAALWYARDGEIRGCTLGGVKAVRECSGIRISGCRIASDEFGWKSDRIALEDCDLESEYAFLDSRDVSLDRVRMRGKYSFQYIDGLEISDCELDTKDAFWHSRNVTVRDSVVKGEYLGWFSENLTLVNCRISGTQPLCYCKGLRLIGCTMEGCDLSFEYSDVEADIVGHVDSVKNPRSGTVTADSVGEVVTGDAVMECSGRVVVRGVL
ncbi:MAG: DUF3737 family protein [Thermoplasmata archaeon]|nr:DUF3737 family protein [Thermoplasmata archaeon]